MNAREDAEIAGSLTRSPPVLGLTGGIGAGKSSACGIFQHLGVPCLDIDLVARHIHQDAAHPAMAALARAIPAAVSPDGTLQRGSLRALFAIDPCANATLKRLIKPYVMAEAARWTSAQHATYVVWESALLVDEAIACDRVLLIDASDEHRMARILRRNPDWSDEQINSIMAMQPPRTTFLKHADDVILNEGSLAGLETQVTRLHHIYTTSWSPQP